MERGELTLSQVHAAAHLKTLTKTQKCYLYLQHNIMQHCPERGICLCFSLSYCKPCVTIPGKEATFSHFPHSACDCPGLAQHPPLAVWSTHTFYKQAHYSHPHPLLLTQYQPSLSVWSTPTFYKQAHYSHPHPHYSHPHPLLLTQYQPSLAVWSTHTFCKQAYLHALPITSDGCLHKAGEQGSLVPRLPQFCSLVCVQYDTQKWKSIYTEY